MGKQTAGDQAPCTAYRTLHLGQFHWEQQAPSTAAGDQAPWGSQASPTSPQRHPVTSASQPPPTHPNPHSQKDHRSPGPAPAGRSSSCVFRGGCWNRPRRRRRPCRCRCGWRSGRCRTAEAARWSHRRPPEPRRGDDPGIRGEEAGWDPGFQGEPVVVGDCWKNPGFSKKGGKSGIRVWQNSWGGGRELTVRPWANGEGDREPSIDSSIKDFELNQSKIWSCSSWHWVRSRV